MSKPLLRVVGFILVFILVVVLPWWLSVVLLVGLTLYLSFYLEVIFFGFLIDILYKIQNNFSYTGIIVATFFLVLTMIIKTRIRRF